MSIIELTDTPMDMMVKMSQGNPGAATVLGRLFSEEPAIDKDSALPSIGSILALDTYGVYGSDIWVLYKDKCGVDIRKLVMLLRACQLGFISQERIKELAADQMMSVNFADGELDELDQQVCDRLPGFQRAA